MTSTESFILEFSLRWLMQWLQWRVSSHNTFGREDIRNISFNKSGLHAIHHVGNPSFVGKYILAQSSFCRSLTSPPPSPISYIYFYLTWPHRGLVSRLAKHCTWGTSALLLFSPSIRLSRSHEMSHMRHGQGMERKQWFYILKSSRFPFLALTLPQLRHKQLEKG